MEVTGFIHSFKQSIDMLRVYSFAVFIPYINESNKMNCLYVSGRLQHHACIDLQ